MFKTISDPDMHDLLAQEVKKVTVPTQIVWGENDQVKDRLKRFTLDNSTKANSSTYLLLSPYKPSLFVGHRQTVQTQIRYIRTWHLIRVSTVCLQNVLLKFE